MHACLKLAFIQVKSFPKSIPGVCSVRVVHIKEPLSRWHQTSLTHFSKRLMSAVSATKQASGLHFMRQSLCTSSILPFFILVPFPIVPKHFQFSFQADFLSPKFKEHILHVPWHSFVFASNQLFTEDWKGE